MAHINLLPWREWERERKKKEFLGNLAGVLVLGAALVFLGGWMLDGNVDYQNARNRFLETRSANWIRRSRRSRLLEQQRDDLKERMELIQELAG